MNTVSMNSKNSKTSDLQSLLLNLSDKVNLKRSDRYVVLSNLSICYIWKNIEKSHKNDQFKIHALTCTDKFELPDGSYAASGI